MASPTADASPWASSPTDTPSEPTVETALAKERTIKDIISLRDGLRGLMVRVTEVENDNDKLAKENEMLAQYMENLCVELESELMDSTRNSVVAAGAKKTR
jgi:hypothetical protein